MAADTEVAVRVHMVAATAVGGVVVVVAAAAAAMEVAATEGAKLNTPTHASAFLSGEYLNLSQNSKHSWGWGWGKIR